MTWACYREGRAATWMRRDVDAVLQAYVGDAVAAVRVPPPASSSPNDDGE